eukprot:scaffold32127_cov101-Isochrysis_galbana.AAC.3
MDAFFSCCLPASASFQQHFPPLRQYSSSKLLEACCHHTTCASFCLIVCGRSRRRAACSPTRHCAFTAYPYSAQAAHRVKPVKLRPPEQPGEPVRPPPGCGCSPQQPVKRSLAEWRSLVVTMIRVSASHPMKKKSLEESATH